MAKEHEIKVLLNIPLNEFLNRAEQFGFQKVKEVHQIDTYFDTATWDLYNTVAALRVRQVDGITKELAFKKFFHFPLQQDAWHVEEIEQSFPVAFTNEFRAVLQRIGVQEVSAGVNSLEDAIHLFEQQGLLANQIMSKVRTVYMKDGAELVIDDIEGLQPIIELEDPAGDPLAILGQLLAPEEWARSIEGTSYLWLEAKYGLTDHKKHNQRFLEQPDWNVLPEEQAWYQEIARR